MLTIYYAQKSELMSDVFWEWCYQQLPQNISDKIKQKSSQKKTQSSLLGYLLLKESLKRNGFCDSINELKKTSKGKPIIISNFDFNISHSGDFVVCAFSEKYSLGIDIERVKPTSLLPLQQFFTVDEWNKIQQSKNSQEQFFRLWTQKEAVVKADGRGLNIPLKEISIQNNNGYVEQTQWFLQEVPLDKNYVMHVATNEPFREYKMVKISFKYQSKPQNQ